MKGFVGPLGDDIPSIFPIVLGVVLFVSSLLYANSQVQNTNNQLSLRSSGLSLSYIVSQNAYLDSGTFSADCNSIWRPYAKNLNLKFVIVVKTYCQNGIDFSENPFRWCQESSFLDRPKANLASFYTCYSIDNQTNSTLSNILSYTNSISLGTNVLPSNAIILSYPISVDCPSSSSGDRCNQPGSMTYGVGTMNVMVWR